MTASDLTAFARELGVETKLFVERYVAKANSPLAADLMALRLEINGLKTANELLTKQLEEVSSRPTGVRYCGVWESGLAYKQDDAVSYDGSLWIARRDYVRTEPSVDHQGWQLCVKRGRDSRDRKDAR